VARGVPDHGPVQQRGGDPQQQRRGHCTGRERRARKAWGIRVSRGSFAQYRDRRVDDPHATYAIGPRELRRTVVAGGDDHGEDET
jgi:hypothetical protein